MAWECVFQGHVQGVGFRYRAVSIARRHAVLGFVRNLPGGDVQLVVDGESQAIEALLTELQHTMLGHIDHVTRREVQLHEPLGSFEIRR